ncbi:MAG: Crp/Fnr family transcriptional regulator [Ideonella sp.]|nr:Crp/Fnr family transcriptional regulator [Ideonella sp.]
MATAMPGSCIDLRLPVPGAFARYTRRALGEPVDGICQIGLAELVELVGGEAPASMGDEVMRFQVLRVARGAELVHEAAPASMLYVVRAGSFKRVKTSEDGYEHVLGFAWRGDVIGFDALTGYHAFAAVALEDSRVVALPRAALRALRVRCEALDQALQVLMARQVAQAGDVAEMMAAVAADARLARFLVLLSARMVEHGQSSRRILLRMSRRDIARHLGLAHETISRSLRALSEAGCLRVADRDVEIVDLQALRRAARSTRGFGEAGARPAWARAA